MTLRWRAVAALALAGLGGCAALAPVDRSLLAGRLAVQVAAHDGTAARGVSVGFELRGTGEVGSLTLHNPLGLQLAAAQWQPGRVVLVSADGEAQFPDLQSLSRHALGEAVPLQALPDWLRGQPWAGAPAAAQPTGFEQLGWSVDLSRRHDGLVTATRHAPPAITVRARLEAPA